MELTNEKQLKHFITRVNNQVVPDGYKIWIAKKYADDIPAELTKFEIIKRCEKCHQTAYKMFFLMYNDEIKNLNKLKVIEDKINELNKKGTNVITYICECLYNEIIANQFYENF